VSSLVHFLKPNGVVVLGDLLSSQYIGNMEFEWRVERYRWIFESVISSGILLINVTGNHDVGYGDFISKHLVKRFENAFGRVNQYFDINGHIFANINSLNLDSSMDKDLQSNSWDHVRGLASAQAPVILLTHIPMHKPSGYCADGPQIIVDAQGYVSQQNFLSEETTQVILEEISPIFVFTGHDHVGCNYIHTNNKTTEHTVRSMMGDFSGNAGLFEIERTEEVDRKIDFKYSFTVCQFVQLQFLSAYIICGILWMISLPMYLIFSKKLTCWRSKKFVKKD